MQPPAAPSPVAADVIAVLRSLSPTDAAGIYRQGLLALKAAAAQDALPFVTAAAARHPDDPRLAQVFGLLARASGDLGTAVSAFQKAASLAPADGLIVHSEARTRLEAGLPAVDAFKRAFQLTPADPGVILGLAAAQFSDGDAKAADALIDDVLRRRPDWLEGHVTLARLRKMTGDGDSLRSYREALARQPRNAALWLGYLSTLLLAERFADIPAVVDAARRAIGPVPVLDLHTAIAWSESGDDERAATAFAHLAAPSDPATMVWHVRYRLRQGQVLQANALAEHGVTMPGGRILWPYLALGWRLSADPRWDWLEGQNGLVRTFDLDPSRVDLGALAQHLRQLHLAVAQPLDQSVRGGTQTDGPLFSRIDPVIGGLREAIVGAVRSYIDGLPPPDPTHPHLACRRDRIEFAGSWSVRLAGGGFHADHVHPQGWISSALYVALPPQDNGEPEGGWLTLGGSRPLLPDLAPFRAIEPKPGRLVLFPSTMWHGTNTFPAGERLTVAFDVALPAT